MNKRHIFIILLAGLMTANVQLASAAVDDLAAIDLVNQAREHNGLLPFKYSATLEQAAENHNRYLVNYRLCGHHQQKAGIVFSGYSFRERMSYVHYASRGGAENINCSKDDYSSWQNATSSLMATIYHRLIFLNYHLDEIGLSYRQGKKSDQTPNKFTFLMGSSAINQLCQSATQAEEFNPSLNQYYLFTDLCLNSETQVNEKDYINLKNTLYKDVPDAIIYPWDGQKNVLPAFLDNENPDPTPTLGLSGMPISVQFTVYPKKVSVTHFTLREVSGKQVEVWQLDHTSDPNKKMSSYEYAWFPVKPLMRATTYRASVRYIVNDQPQEKSWTFQTEPYHYPSVHLISKENHSIFSPTREKIVVQWEDGTDTINSLLCWCTDCNPKVEGFDTVSLTTSSDNVDCTIVDKAGNKLTFFVNKN